MSHQQLLHIRRQLDQALVGLGSRRISSPGLGAGDIGEQALSEVEADVAVAAANVDWRTAKDVRSALQRLETPGFGSCQRCDREVGEKRLRAIPWARLCVRCQEAADAEADIRPRLLFDSIELAGEIQ
jgi:DnaK suppressor protein